MIDKYVVLILFSVFIASVSQILLKMSACRPYCKKIYEYLNSYVVSAYALFIISTLLTVLSLKGIPLSRAPVYESAGYLYIMVLSRIFFKERITASRLAGNILIIAGILLFVSNF